MWIVVIVQKLQSLYILDVLVKQCLSHFWLHVCDCTVRGEGCKKHGGAAAAAQNGSVLGVDCTTHLVTLHQSIITKYPALHCTTLYCNPMYSSVLYATSHWDLCMGYFPVWGGSSGFYVRPISHTDRLESGFTCPHRSVGVWVYVSAPSRSRGLRACI